MKIPLSATDTLLTLTNLTKAVVIFLEIRGSERRRSQLLDDVTWLGELFDVAVVPLGSS